MIFDVILQKEDCGRLRKIVYVRSKQRDRVTMSIADVVVVVVDLLFFLFSNFMLDWNDYSYLTYFLSSSVV
jgi:hypothetical protein